MSEDKTGNKTWGKSPEDYPHGRFDPILGRDDYGAPTVYGAGGLLGWFLPRCLFRRMFSPVQVGSRKKWHEELKDDAKS